jgi:hypothetical protein
MNEILKQAIKKANRQRCNSKYYLKNKEKLDETNRLYALKNKANRQKYFKAYYKKNKTIKNMRHSKYDLITDKLYHSHIALWEAINEDKKNPSNETKEAIEKAKEGIEKVSNICRRAYNGTITFQTLEDFKI